MRGVMEEPGLRRCALQWTLSSWLWGCLVLFASFGYAPAASAAGGGVLRGVVFGGPKARPLVGVKIGIQGLRGTLRTDRDGAFWVRLPAGRVRLTLRGPGLGLANMRTRALPVVEGEVTELVITIVKGRSGAPQVQVEAAVRKRVRRKVRRQRGPLLRLAGEVRTKAKGAPIAGARIYVRGLSAAATTDARGRFAMRVPPGTYDLTVIHPKYQTASHKGLKLLAKRPSVQLKVQMMPAALQLKTLTVLAPRITGSTVELMRQRKAASGVSEVLGAQEMARAGDSNAASALKRVSGVTLVGGKYIYVRGLGERYSSALLNGSTLPSPEPERRVVPLDLFPANVLEKVVIEKTYLPSMPGEFAGGSVQLFTRGFPAKLQVSLSLSLGISMGASFTQGLRSQGGKTDFLGFDGGTRALPGTVVSATRSGPLAERDLFSSRGFTAQQLEAFGEAMSNRWAISRSLLPPDIGFAASIGDQFRLWGAKAGYFVSLSYSNGWDVTHPQSDIYVLGGGGKLEKAHSYQFEKAANNIRLSGLVALGVDFNKHHKLRLTTLINRISEDETRQYQGFNRDVDSDIRVTRLRWVEQMLFTQQLRGMHQMQALGGLHLDWRYTYSMASRNEPDRREVRYDKEPGKDLWLLSDRPEGNQRLFSELLDHNHDLGVDMSFFFRQWAGKKGRIQVGGAMVLKARGADTRRFKFLHKGPVSGDSNVLSKSPEDIFTPEHIGAGGFQLGEITRQTDNYKAEQQILGAYAMLDLPLGWGLRFTGGARLEYGRQQVETFALFNPDKEPVVASLETLDVLPGVNLSWSLSKRMVLRAAFARTVSRPDFRELSPATFNDVTGGRQIFGNPDLKRAIIWHADLRWEWYLGRGESLSVAAFYKRFEKPIETIVVVSAQHSITYANALGAHNLGVELDFRKRFGFIHKSLRDLYIAGNLTFVWSQIELDAASGGIQTSNARALQGQSPYVFNVQLGYDNADMGTRVALLYNVFGARIESVGALGAPDVFEQPFHQLDLVFRQRLGRGFHVALKAKNLLDLPAVLLQGDKVTSTYRKGRSFGVSFGYQF